MPIITRSLSYSLIIHISLLCVFIVALSHESKKESRTPLKLQMISLPTHTAAVNPKPMMTQPIPIPKPTPIIPTPVIKAPSTPVSIPKNQQLPTATTVPKQSAQPVAATFAPVQAEAPKTVHTISAPPSVPSVNVEKEFLDAHLGEIRALLIQNLKYPRNAQRLKMQGEVRVSFRLKSNGSVENIEVLQSSGFEILDEDAKALIKNTAPQFPKPSKSVHLSVPLAYLLR